MKKFALLVLIATTVSYSAEPERNTDPLRNIKIPAPLPRAIIDGKVPLRDCAAGAGFFFFVGNLCRLRPIFAIPLTIISGWQAFIPKAPNTPSLQENLNNLSSIFMLWGNKISRQINDYKTQLQKDEIHLQKQQPSSASAPKNSDQK